jgi:uncharacterized Zn finger protein
MREWGERWLGRVSGGDATVRRRLERGRAGVGRLVEALQIEPGAVRMRVPDGRGRSHDVTIEIPPIDDAAWDAIVTAVGREIRHTAALLEGELPEVLVEQRDLLPEAAEARCSCSETRPCRHIAAAHHAIATALDRDPRRLLRLRGRSADELLDALRAARGGASEDAPAELDLDAPFAARGDLDAIVVHPVPEPDVTTVFEQLGPPPGFEDSAPLEDLMAAAAALAWRLAAGEGAAVADDEALLAELRAQGVATAASIAGSLGLDAAVAQAALDRLYGDGQVLRMGAGDSARYRAA